MINLNLGFLSPIFVTIDVKTQDLFVKMSMGGVRKKSLNLLNSSFCKIINYKLFEGSYTDLRQPVRGINRRLFISLYNSSLN